MPQQKKRSGIQSLKSKQPDKADALSRKTQAHIKPDAQSSKSQSHGRPEVQSLKTHDHACSIYEHFDQQRIQFVPYLQAGLLLGDRCIYFIDHNQPQFVLDAMQENGFDLKPYIERLAFSIVPTKDAYLTNDYFEVQKMIDYWADTLAKAEKDGFPATRAAAEMTWAMSGKPGCERLAAYEVQLNNFVDSNKLSIMCQYYRREFSADILQDIIHAHPIIITADTVLSHPAHLKPEEFVEGSSDLHLRATLETLMMANKMRKSNDELQQLLIEQKRLQQELLDSEQERLKAEIATAEQRQHRLIAEAIPQIVWTADNKGHIDYFNPYWCSYTGMSLEATQGNGWVSVVHQDDSHRILEKWEQSCTTRQPFEDEYRFRRADGAFRWHLVRSVPVRDQWEQIVKWFGVCIDIDDQKLLTAQLEVARDKAEESTRVKSMFLANMSHEIRTPMNAIIGMCNILLKTQLGTVQHHYASNIREGATALLTVINDILDFSKIEAGKLELEIVNFDPVRIVESTGELLSTTARSKQISLMTYIDPAIPDQLRGDPEKIRQILINLTANAIKFSRQGEIVIGAKIVSTDINFVQVRFSVADQGIGVSPEEESKLFQPFAQADGSISRKFGGTGLGLSICKRLVDLMQGSIGVDSRPGEGSTFWFVIPVDSIAELPPAAKPPEVRNVRILVVDDEPQAGKVLHDYLAAWDMRTTVVSSAKEALKVLRQEQLGSDPYKVAIIDYGMPEMSGIDMATEIFADAKLSETKLILVTATDSPGMGLRAIEAGFKAYLTKPVKQSNLLESITTALNDGNPIISSTAADGRMRKIDNKLARTELILIAEDYPINQQVAQIYLDELGFDSHIVSNGKEALAALLKGTYALILMDCQMPEMDGYAATGLIRKAERLSGKHIPIVAMTAHAMGGDRENCLAAGMDDYITKPVEPDELCAILDKWLPHSVPTSEKMRSELRQRKLVVEQAKNPPLDLPALKLKYGANAERLVALFKEDAPALILKINAALDANDNKDLAVSAHSLKGLCGTVCAPPMRQLCSDIEVSMKEREGHDLSSIIKKLSNAFKELQQYSEDSKKGSDQCQ